MDLESVMSDKALLASLSREYELLKATNASIDWEDWITARLKRAAARRTTSGGGNLAAQQQQQQPGALPPLARHGNISLRTPSKAQQPAGVCCVSSSGLSSVADAGRQAPDWQAQDVTNSTHLQHTTQAQPPQPSLVRLHDRTSSSGGGGTEQQAPPVAQGPSGLLAPPSGPQPHWVAAARLGMALQASKVVATMHAAADRKRRLAAAAAVAKQQLDLGISDAVLACGTGSQQQQLQPGAQEQLQHMAKLTQEVVEQNQLLQQAMTQQQAQLSQHQGILTAVLQQAGGGSAGGTSGGGGPAATAGQAAAGASVPAAQQQPAVRADAADAACSPDKVRDQIKDSWLVKKLLQQGPDSDSKQGSAGRAESATDFIRIAGAAKQLRRRSAAEQPLAAEPKQQGAAADAGASAQDRRKQLKGVLRQLLTKGAVGQLPDGLAGLVDGLRGLQAASAAQQAQGGQGGKTGAQSQAASLVALLQQHQAGRTQLNKAQRLVLQHRKAQEEEERRRQQEQGEQQEASSKPGWQSEVYVAPPSRMLRVKKGAAVDVWNATDSGTPGRASKPAGSKTQPSRRKPAARSAAGAHPKHPAKRHSKSSVGDGRSAPNLASVLYGSRWRVDGGLREQQQQQQRSATEGCFGTDYSRLARVEEATTQVLEAVARLEQSVQQQQEQQQVLVPRCSSAAAGTVTAEEPLQLQEPAALAGLLSALERVEQQEKDIRERWFGSSSGGATDDGSSSACAEAMPQDAAPKARQAGAECAAQASNPDRQPAVERSMAARSDDEAQQQQQQLALVDQSQQHGCEQPLEETCALSPAAMQAIKAGRQRFLRHQARLDGTLHELGSGGSDPAARHTRSRTVLQPHQVVEAVADLLLDELLLQEAQGLDGFCDALCEQLIEGEFLPAA